MKVTVNQYAKTLYESVTDKPKKEIPGIIVSFIKLLAKNHQIKNGRKIIEKFGDIYNKENGIIEAEVTSREALSNMLGDQIKSFIKKKYQAKEAVLKNIIDEKIKGGIVIKVGDELMDASVAKQLEKLRSSLEK